MDYLATPNFTTSLARDYFFEFAGMPKSGKTTVIEIIAHFFRRAGYKIQVHADTGTYAPIGKDDLGSLNAYLACKAVEFLMTMSSRERQSSRIFLIDRGVFDRRIFTLTLASTGHISATETTRICEFLDLMRFAKVVDGIFLFRCEPTLAIERELANKLVRSSGQIVNSDFLTSFRKVSTEVFERGGNNFQNVFLIDTDNDDPSATSKRVLDQMLEIIENTNLPATTIINPSFLERHGSLVVDTRFESAHESTKTLVISGRKYWRYMDYFYIPRPPNLLSQDEVVQLCDLRLRHLDKTITKSLNRAIVHTMISEVRRRFSEDRTRTLRLLDVGCGSGLSGELAKEADRRLEVVGVDASAAAIKRATAAGLDARLINSKNSELDFPDASFDAAIAVFLLHFNIADALLREIRRVVSPKGIFLFNIFNADTSAVIDKLQLAGFAEISIVPCKSIPSNHQILAASGAAR